jgi:hypothetical protein
LSRFNFARIVLTVIALFSVRTSFVSRDVSEIVCVAMSHTLSLILLGIIEVISAMVSKEAERDD